MEKTDCIFRRPSLLSGAARLFDFGGCLRVAFPAEGESEPDARALKADWRAIGDDMRVALAAYRKE